MQNNNSPPQILRWQEIASMYRCGRSKALLILHHVGVRYVGRTPYISSQQLEAHIREHGGISVSWPHTNLR
jgi:hypothetical protein